MADQFVGEVRCVGFNFPPFGWQFCNGQLLAIGSNSSLFSLFGTAFGGNGTSNFALPNLQGNVAIGQGNGSGLSPRVIGTTGGVQNVILPIPQMPSHNHSYMTDFQDGPANSGIPAATAAVSFGPQVFSAPTSQTQMMPSMLGATGGNQLHNNMMPYLVLNFVISLQGIFPVRN